MYKKDNRRCFFYQALEVDGWRIVHSRGWSWEITDITLETMILRCAEYFPTYDVLKQCMRHAIARVGQHIMQIRLGERIEKLAVNRSIETIMAPAISEPCSLEIDIIIYVNRVRHKEVS